MSTISNVNSGSNYPSGTAGNTTTAPAQQTLGQDDFLKLLAQQFQSQDPMQPMDNTAFISQMAQFTALQQTSTMSKDISAMRSAQESATANSYLGHTVTVDAGNGATASGTVSEVDESGSSPQLVINGTSYDLSAVLTVQPSGVATTPTTNPNPTA